LSAGCHLGETGGGIEMNTVGEVLRSLSAQLGSTAEARWILSHAAACATPGAARILTRPGEELPAGLQPALVEMVRRRRSGEPLQYVLGTWQFRQLEVAVDPRVLIPRPETEEVVTHALARLCAVGRDRVVAADLGTGSGVIALSLAAEVSPRPPSLEVWATDSSEDALAVARQNLELVSLHHPRVRRAVRLARGDWFAALPGELARGLDLVVSNPPYVSASEWKGLSPEVRDYEPHTALVPGRTGLEAFEKIVLDAPLWMVSKGSLVLELGPHQADAVTQMALSSGFVNVEVHPDMAGVARVLTAVMP